MNYDELVSDDRVDGSIYTSSEVFADEIERIFHRWWLYIGHESEVSEPGDYKQVWMGLQPVIMARGEDGELHLLLNRCRHRGNTVCEEACGNSLFFRCQYHGWTYANDGKLIGVPFPDAYDESFRKEDFGLTRVPRMGVYRGFVFASLSEDVIPFDEYLGTDARAMIDMFCDLSPDGEIEASAGAHKSSFAGNWKFVGMDGYHAPFVHRSMQDVLADDDVKQAAKARDKKQFSLTQVVQESSGNTSHDFGHGHVRLNYAPSRVNNPEVFVRPYRETEWGRAYLGSLEEKLGAERAHALLASGGPHTGIWPNLQLIDVHIRVIRPVAPGRTEVYMSPTRLKGVPPELNAQRLRQHEFAYGPCSFIVPDDYEIFERNQVGLRATLDGDVLLARGTHRESNGGSGGITGSFSDEVTQRGQLREWKRVMTLNGG